MKRFLKPALAILSLAMLGACSDDHFDVDDSTGNVAEKSEIRYLRVAICNPDNQNGLTKANPGDGASDYAAGTAEENKIRTLDFYFYDDHKFYLSHTSMRAEAFPGADTPTPNDDTNLNNVEAIYNCNVPVTLVQGERLPAYVLCIVNGVNPNAYEEKSMEDAQQQLLYSLYDLDTQSCFGMNNSVYYGTDNVTGETDQLIMATPFDTRLLKTASEIEKAPASNAQEALLKIYVERYAAKVTLNMAGAVSDFKAGNPNNEVTLKFTPGKWGLNAYEKSFYLIKSYRDKDNPLKFAAFDKLGTELFPGWNRPDDFRSFWARTPAYFEDNYPVVTDDILDNITEPYNPNFEYGERIDGYPYLVYYSSFNSVQGVLDQPQYVMETTLKENRLNGTDMPAQYLPINSVPSVVLTGTYTVNVNGDDYINKTFYTYSQTNGVPNVLAANEGELGDVPTLLNTLINHQNIILVKRENGQYTSFNTSDLKTENDRSIFKIDHPAKTVRNNGSMKIPGDIVTLQINALNGKELYYFSPRANGNTYSRITESNLTEVNQLLYKNVGGAHAYVNGMAFFTAPIQHWGWHRSDNANKGKTMDEWDWSKMKAGDFGIVRNHVYTINVNSITGLGTGIRNVNDPLLPSADKIGYNIHFDVYIQKWAVLPTQIVSW